MLDLKQQPYLSYIKAQANNHPGTGTQVLSPRTQQHLFGFLRLEIGMEQPEDEVVIMEVEEEGGGVKGKGKGKAKGKVPSERSDRID
ncbi:hypothetical protein Tsubulata_013894 [Turnera subulata]|uniref:Uncharacterized protein n=1 Tax=Turnera subulata TaxID=218843 RepID=A0A9Q0F909_9ROSI|nr:hypothetical protein Tsubulata_013894 [Turnera subulata]